MNWTCACIISNMKLAVIEPLKASYDMYIQYKYADMCRGFAAEHIYICGAEIFFYLAYIVRSRAKNL